CATSEQTVRKAVAVTERDETLERRARADGSFCTRQAGRIRGSASCHIWHFWAPGERCAPGQPIRAWRVWHAVGSKPTDNTTPDELFRHRLNHYYLSLWPP